MRCFIPFVALTVLPALTRAYFQPFSSRRSLLRRTLAPAVVFYPLMKGPAVTAAAAMPKSGPAIELNDFLKLLSSSPSSFAFVELSNPNLTDIVVELTDGTRFSVVGAMESSSDPRSPLQVISKCRDLKVQYYTNLLGSNVRSPTKVYKTDMARLAESKNAEKRKRMARDEEERLKNMENLGLGEAPRTGRSEERSASSDSAMGAPSVTTNSPDEVKKEAATNGNEERGVLEKVAISSSAEEKSAEAAVLRDNEPV